jgi:hypothetical protein
MKPIPTRRILPVITLKNVSNGAFVIASVALIASLPAVAQPKPGASKTVFENGKVSIIDSVTKPGEGLPSAARGD